MIDVTKHLERHLQSFIDDPQPFSFFKGLSGYLDYAFTVPELKTVFEKEIEERNADYQKLDELEEKSLKELREVKSKFLQIIKKRKIDIQKFHRYSTWVFRAELNILEELEAYENKAGIYSGRPMSEIVEDYLFDIGANFLGLGYKKDVEKFLALPEDYQRYEINRNIHVTVNGNPEGFIFSRALWERRDMNKVIERGRALKPWGSFEKLYQFSIAYKNSQNAKDPMINFQSGYVGEFGIQKIDLVEITHMQADLDNYVKKHKPFAQNISRDPERHLALQDFVPIVKSVHNILMNVASKMQDNMSSTEYWVAKDSNTGEYYFKGNKIHFSSPNAGYTKIFKAVCEILPKGGSVLYKDIPFKKDAVQRALTGEEANFFRYVKSVKRVPQHIPLFEASRDGKE